MAALTPLSQLSSGNPAHESFYRQVDPGKLALQKPLSSCRNPDFQTALCVRSGICQTQREKGFFAALRLVASAQGGSDVSLNSLSQNSAPIPKFRDADSPSLNITTSAADSRWTIKPEDKAKYDGIFESLSPIGGLLSDLGSQ